MHLRWHQIDLELEESQPGCICRVYFNLKSVRASCGTYVPVHLGTGVTGRMHGIIESSQLLPSSSFQSESRLLRSFLFLFPSLGTLRNQSRDPGRFTDRLVSVLPGIAFSLHLIESTEQYGVSEVLLSSFMASFIFSVFGAQPLCIAGVTGL